MSNINIPNMTVIKNIIGYTPYKVKTTDTFIKFYKNEDMSELEAEGFNIEVFASRCKKWIFEEIQKSEKSYQYGHLYSVFSGYRDRKCFCEIEYTGDSSEKFYAETEEEALFRAANWISELE